MLEVINVSKTYKPKKGPPVKALKNVSITFEEKGMVFLIGKSGCGKSTLLNIIGGLDSFEEGEIIIKGKSSKEFSGSDFDSYRNTFIGFIFQEYNILKEFSVAKNIAIALELQGKKAGKKEIDSILAQVGMLDFGKRKVTELSGGQKQRVAIARALIKDPQIIFADEPTGALDSSTGRQVLETLKELSKNKLVVVVSHDREFAEIYGDRIVELSDGVVINDIVKLSVAPKEVSSNVNFMGDNLIKVEKGSKLSKKEIELLIEKISSSNEDVFISSDKTYNESLRKNARINKEGKIEKFRQTKKSDIKTKKYDKKELKLIKSKLKYRDSFKLGVSGLKTKPFRLIFTIFLSMVALGMFGLADTLGSYDKVTASIQSIKDTNIQNLSISKNFKIYWDQNYYEYKSVGMKDEDISNLSEKLDVDFKPVFMPIFESSNSAPPAISMNPNFQATSNLSGGLDFSDLYGLAHFSRTELEEFGFNIVGQMPTQNNEIAISSYTFSMFKKAGYVDLSVTPNEVISAENIFSESTLIGKKLKINNKFYTLTAIVDTKFDSARYEKLFQSGTMDIGSFLLVSELADVVCYGFHGMGFVAEGVVDELVAESKQTLGCGNQKYWHLNYVSGETNTKWTRRVIKLSQFADENAYMFFDENKTKLDEKEVLISFEWLMDESEEFRTLFYNTQYQVVDNYVTSDVFDEAVENGFEQDRSTYINLLMDRWNSNGLYFFNPFGEIGNDIIWRGQIENLLFNWETIKGMVPENFKASYRERYSNSDDVETEIYIVGLFIPYFNTIDKTDSYWNSTTSIVLADDWYDEIEKMSSGLYSYAIASMPTSNSKLTEILNFTFKDQGNTRFMMKNAVAGAIEKVNTFIELTSKIFLYVGIGFAVFSALMLMNFIATSISYKKQEIGILRAVGARGADVFGIFFNESLVITLINFALSVSACAVAIFFINQMMRTEFGVVLTILNFGIRQVSLMLLISVAVSFVASIFPVTKIARKKPIDAINNR